MESQTVEWKLKWDEKYLKQICAFANTNGGIMKVGIDDDGNIVGVQDPKSDMKKITDTIANKLSLYPKVKVDKSTNVITITVERSPVPVDLNGNFYIRTGNTTHAATGREYDLLVTRRIGVPWSDMPMDGLDITCLDPVAINTFRKMAIEKNIIDRENFDVPDKDLLMKLKLMTRDGVPTRAAILLFHQQPEDLITGSSVKVGLFEGTDSTEIVYQDYIGGPLITMPSRLLDLINTKYSKKHISYKGLNMVETAPYPESSLRETLLNAVMHNDYSSANPIQIRIWENRMRIADSGGIPYDWKSEDLFGEHDSVPVNPNIANAFFYTGAVEGWGRGIKRIIDGYKDYPGMEPEFKASHYSFTVILKNINYIPNEIQTTKQKPDVNIDLLGFLDIQEGRTSREIAEFLDYNPSSVTTRKIRSLIESGLVERMVADANRSGKQRYRLTEVGKRMIGNP